MSFVDDDPQCLIHSNELMLVDIAHPQEKMTQLQKNHSTFLSINSFDLDAFYRV